MKFPNFFMNKSFTARALVLLAGLFLLVSAASAQKKGSRFLQDVLVPEAVGLNIEQCANGPFNAPILCNVTGGNDGYVRGNLVASKSHYLEGDSVPIRILATGLDFSAGNSYTITIGYDYTKGGHYATDYLTSFDRTEPKPGNNPCVGVTGCGVETQTAIPADPEVALGYNGIDDGPAGPTGGDDITQIPGVFSCFGCVITDVSNYTRTGLTTGDSSKFLTLTFTASQADIVIAYGSHISTRDDWGFANSAINISGSPYHNFISANTIPGANSGNRDLQLSAEAVIFPANIVIEKAVYTFNPGGTPGTSATFQFGFTSTALVWPNDALFTLVDQTAEPFNPAMPVGATTTSSGIISFGTGNLIDVVENNYSPTWGAPTVTCTSTSSGAPTQNNNTLITRGVRIQLEEGELVHCLFLNQQLQPTAAPASVTGQVTRPDGSAIGGVSVTLTNVTTGEIRQAITNAFGFYVFDELEVNDFYMVQVSAKRVRFNNDTITFTLTEDLTGVDFVSNQ